MKRFLAFIIGLLVGLPLYAFQVYTPLGTMDANFALTESWKATYSVAVPDVAPAATATDIVVLRASATKTVRVTSVWVSGDATGNATVDIYIYKRTAANTGGTSSAQTPAKYQTSDPAVTATVVMYTANPSALGAGVLVRAGHIALAATSNPTVPVNPLEFSFGDRPAKTIVLAAGSNEALAINFGGNAVPSGTQLYINIEWTEE